jgi:hypothetical protein
MAETGIQKAFETPGVFWLPGGEAKLSGHLKYAPESGLHLALVGKFSSIPFQNYPVIHGALDNEFCTLFNSNISHVSSGVIHQTGFDSRLALIGDHVPSIDAPMFDGLKIRFHGLDEWVNYRAFAPAISEPKSFGPPTRFDLLTQVPIVTTSKELGGSVSLIGMPSGRYWHRRIDWEYHNYFEVNFDKPVNVTKLIDVAFELQHFLALLTWNRSPIEYFSAFRSVSTAESQSGKKRSGLYGHWSVSAPNQRSSGPFLTTLADISEELPKMADSWFKSLSGIKTARNLFTSILKSEGQYLEFTFLALMQIAEALHRSLDSKSYMQPDDYEAVKKSLIEAIPKNIEADHRTSLESRIKYGNELSLRTRLKALFLRIPEILQQQITKDRKTFVSKVVDARNVLTHPNTDPKAPKPGSDELLEFSQGMKLLLTILFFNEMGLSFEKITAIAKTPHWELSLSD